MGGPTPRTAVASQQDILLRLALLERRLATGVVPSRLGPVLARVRDGNDAVPTGTFWLLQGGSTLNSPDTAQHWAVETFALDSGSYYQRASRIGSTAIYADVWVRRFSATWSAWTPLSLSLRSFTPTIRAGATLGNGTLSGMYEVADGLLTGHIRFTLGSTSAITGGVQFAPPLTPAGIPTLVQGSGRATIGASTFELRSLVNVTDIFAYAVVVDQASSGVAYSRIVPLTSAIPGTWASGSILEAAFSYPII